MISTTFVLRSIKRAGVANLYAQVRDKSVGLSLLFSVPISVDVSEWRAAHNDKSSKKAIKSYNDSDEGRRVSTLIEQATAQISVAVSEGVTTAKELQKRVEDAIRLDEARKTAEEAKRLRKSSVLDYFDNFIEKMSKGEVKTAKKRDFDKSTQKYYRDTRRYFGEYLKENTDITFNDLNNDIVDGFLSWMDNNNIMRSTQKNVLSCCHAVCNRAWNSGLVSPDKVGITDLWKMPTPNEDEVRAEVVLNENEINALWDLSCSGTLDKDNALVVDVLLAGLYSMQRFSDYSRFSKDMVRTDKDGRKFLHFIQDKTGVIVDVPLVGRLAEIMERNGYDLTFLNPKTRTWEPKVNYQKFGKSLRKILGRLAESVPSLREEVVTVLTRSEIEMESRFQYLLQQKNNGKIKTASNEYYVLLRDLKIQASNGCMGTSYLWKRNAHGEVIKPKWSLMNSHVARRSGITKSLEDGVLSDDLIRKISGHKTLKSFKKYDKRSKEAINAKIFDALESAAKSETKVVSLRKEA